MAAIQSTDLHYLHFSRCHTDNTKHHTLQVCANTSLSGRNWRCESVCAEYTCTHQAPAKFLQVAAMVPLNKQSNVIDVLHLILSSCCLHRTQV